MSLLLLLSGVGGPANYLSWTEDDDVVSISATQLGVAERRVPDTLIWLYDIHGNRVNVLRAHDLELDERLFQSYTIKFSLPATDQKALHLVEDTLVIVDGERFFIRKVEKSRDGVEADVTVYAEASWMKLADLKRPGSFILEDKTVIRGLSDILQGTGWSIDVASLDPTERQFEATDASVLDLLWQWAKVCNCEVAFDIINSRVSMLPQVGVSLGLGFRYGRNLTQIKRTSIPPRVTRLYCYGRSDLSIETITGGDQFVENYDYYTDQGMTLEEAKLHHVREDIYRDDSFIDAQALYDASISRLATLSAPQVTYAVGVVDLTHITGVNETSYRIGDSVYVFDGILDIDLTVRVSRTLKYPVTPSENKVELTAGDILLPDPSVSNARSNTTLTWEMFESRNWIGERRVRNFSTILNRIGLRTVDGAEWIVGYKISGVGVGTGTITITPVDDETLEPLWPAKTFSVADGEPFNWDFTYGKKEVESGDHTLVIRATSSDPGVGIDLEPYETALWVHARGTTRKNVVLANSIRFDYTGAVQQWTVPDDVFEVMFEIHGACGGGGFGLGGNGLKISGRFAVLGGQIYDLYIGGVGVFVNGGWPNGGQGGTGGGTGNAPGGGGSTDIRPAGAAFIDAIAVAAGGGGESGQILNAPATGGYGGFYQGGDGNRPDVSGTGATQETGGLGGDQDGSDAGPAPNGTFGQGGNGQSNGNAFARPGGGGGGGWYGGGGGSFFNGSGDLKAGSGGGGSGWISDIVYDLEFIDDENDGNHGFAILSWETPE